MIKRLFKVYYSTYLVLGSRKPFDTVNFLGIDYKGRLSIKLILKKILGINFFGLILLCNQFNIPNRLPIGFFNEVQLVDFKSLLFSGSFLALRGYQKNKIRYFIGASWEKKEKEHLLKIRQTGFLRAIRLRKGLPVRGQRTKTNAQTARLFGGKLAVFFIFFCFMGYFRFLCLSTKSKFRFLPRTTLRVKESTSFLLGGVLPNSILFIYCRWNNTHLVLVRLQGTTIFKLSSGCIGLKGRRRKTPYCGQRLGSFAAQKALFFGYSVVFLFIKFFGKARYGLAKGLCSESRFLVLGVFEISRLPYNGCRSSKIRRL
jgi:small subunit ribosomal protein S11